MIPSNAAQFLTTSGWFRDDSPVAPIHPYVVPKRGALILAKAYPSGKRYRAIGPAAQSALDWVRGNASEAAPVTRGQIMAALRLSEHAGWVIQWLYQHGLLSRRGEAKHSLYWPAE